MELLLNGMTLKGTPSELATFVKQYESKATWTYPQPPQKPPWYYGGGGTGTVYTGIKTMLTE